ncbi:hypothetical protein CC80DRAFT_500635 [Byssothecium circinans]|uniref:Uncharacterized protein n=1 Tax=Byssothecium circinans TaxID=147558 RepID=A0A6A5UBN2_9PLEO|nr:hypothetical protein CC80DRAFT_500635 [Byssothecium circinans]
MKGVSSLLATAASVQAQLFVYNLPAPVEDRAPLPTLVKRADFNEPCQRVSASWAAAASSATAASPLPSTVVPAEDAYKCLQTVPVDKDGDLKQLQELKQMLQFHSTLSYLKQGLKDNIEPVDVMGKLDEMAKKLNEGGFKSEYEFQLGIRQLFISTGDFHLRWKADILEPFTFGRAGAALTSLSKDGLAFPEVWLVSDVNRRKRSNMIESQISPIKSINGQDAVKYLQNISTQNQYHDPDARYNRLFINKPRLGAGYLTNNGPFWEDGLYDGPTTELEFKNGTKQALPNVATIERNFDFRGVESGESFFKKFCTGGPSMNEDVVSNSITTSRILSTLTSAAAKSTHTVSKREDRSSLSSKASSAAKSAIEMTPIRGTPTKTISRVSSIATTTRSTAVATATGASGLTGYPKAEFVSDSLAFSGYYLNDTGYDDVAVLAVPDFQPTTRKNIFLGLVQVQKLLRTFFAQTTEKKKNRLVIDLRGNGGGTIDMGFEFFRQLFPTIEPYGGARYRAHDAFKILSASLAAIDANQTVKAINKVVSQKVENDNFVWNNVLNANLSNFKSFDDYYGPYTLNDDTFTSIRRYNFSDHSGGHTTAPDFNLTGYAPVPAPPQPFKSENIVLLQDGSCGSTCAIFAELMREQGKVHTIFIGGRPQAGPAQGVGGSKGVQVLPMDNIQADMIKALERTLDVYGKETAEYMNNTAVGALAATTQLLKRSAHYNSENINGAVNSLNNYRQGDKTDTPLEFVYEAADCRIFDTFESFFDPAVLWKRAVDVKWGEAKCVEGSQGDKTAISVVDGKAFNKQPEGMPKKEPEAKGTPGTPKNAAGMGARVEWMAVVGAAVVFAAGLL